MNLGEKVRELYENDVEVTAFVDGSCSSGCDENNSADWLVDLGLRLAAAAYAYSPSAKVFSYTDEDESTTFFQFGLDEADAVRRLVEAVV